MAAIKWKNVNNDNPFREEEVLVLEKKIKDLEGELVFMKSLLDFWKNAPVEG